MAIIKNISKLVVPAYNKGPKDVIDYINNQAWAPTSADVGLVEYPGDFGSYVGSVDLIIPNDITPFLQATIIATDLVIPVTNHTPPSKPLSSWPASGYAQVDSEIFYYSSILRGAFSPSTYDEFIISSTANRGVKGTTAVGHTAGAGAFFTLILIGATTKIEYNKTLGVFNVWTRTTQQRDLTGFYGDNGWTYEYMTYLIPCPEDVVTFFETSPGVN
jgi:hypothetical protein|tara:strand:+ start:2593 stop:3243 length:651 start_codon:yes stop_codon:yes gene_type:complete